MYHKINIYMKKNIRKKLPISPTTRNSYYYISVLVRSVFKVHGFLRSNVGQIAYMPTFKCSSDTWSNRQVSPWSTKWSRAKASRLLQKEFTGHSKHPLTTTQKMTLHMNITRWSIPKSDWVYALQPKMEKLYTVSKNKTGLRSDHELLISKFRLILKNVGKTTRPFRYDQNQIPYDYTVEMTNRFKWLDLIDSGPEELWMEVHNIV